MRRKFKRISSEVDHKIFNFFFALWPCLLYRVLVHSTTILCLWPAPFDLSTAIQVNSSTSISLRKHLTSCTYLWVQLACIFLCLTHICWATSFTFFAATFWKFCIIGCLEIVGVIINPAATKLQKRDRQWNPMNTTTKRSYKSNLCHKHNLTLINKDYQTAPIS